VRIRRDRILLGVVSAYSFIASQIAIADTIGPMFEGITDRFVQKYGTTWTRADRIGGRDAKVAYHGISAAIDKAAKLIGEYKAEYKAELEKNGEDTLDKVFAFLSYTLDKFLNRRIANITPSQLNYRMLVARLYIHILDLEGFDKRELNRLYTKYCGRSIDDEEEKWWEKFLDNGRKGYSPVSDIRKYWESMHIDRLVYDRFGVIARLYNDTLKSNLIEPKVIAEDFRGKPVTCACRMFAMNRNMPIMPAPEDGADGASLSKDPGLQWRAMRNVVGQLRTSYNSNMDVELEILDEGWKKEREIAETADGIKDPTAVGCYEYLRWSVLCMNNSDQMPKLEPCTRARNGENEKSVISISDGAVEETAYSSYSLIFNRTDESDGNIDVLAATVRNKEVFVVNASGKEIARAFKDIPVTVKTSDGESQVVKEKKAEEALALLDGAVGGVKFRDSRLSLLPTFIIKGFRESDAVTLQGELISDTHGTEWTADSNAERREKIVVGKEEGVVAHLHGLMMTESFNGGKRVETTVWTRGGDGGYVRTEFSKKGNGDEVEENEVGIEELLEAIGSRKPGAPKSLRNLIAIYCSITLAGAYPVISIMVDDDEPTQDSEEDRPASPTLVDSPLVEVPLDSSLSEGEEDGCI
jgi:hypothetical protein